MKILSIMLIFAGVILIDGILLPSLFHVYGGLLGFAFLASLLVVYGNEPAILVLALVVSFALELWHGFYFASLAGAVICTAGIWQMANDFFSIEPFINQREASLSSALPLLGVGYVLVAVTSIVFLGIEKYLYRADVSWATLRLAVLSPTGWLVVGCGLMTCMLLMRLSARGSGYDPK